MSNPSQTPEIYRQRLLNVAKALRESPKPEAFDMEWFTYGEDQRFPCGTPMCALGHYGARSDLQDAFRVVNGYLQVADKQLSQDRLVAAERHFGLTERQTEELFCYTGCGGATSVEEAATYIEGFVASKYGVTK